MLNHTPIMTRRYRVHHLLGTGNIGEVYAAFDRLTGNSVALKRVLCSSDSLHFNSRLTASHDTDLRHLLTDEFRVLASLRHAYVASVLDYGFDAEQYPYYTTSLLNDSRTILDAGRAFTFVQKIQALAQMLQGLAYLHRRGIGHRNIKAGNVLVGADNIIKLVDFGLAVQGADASSAPEYLTVPQSDLYTLGVLAYEMFTGRAPFDLENPSDFLAQILSVVPPSDRLHALLMRLLMKDPAERYASAESVLTDLALATDVGTLEETRVQPNPLHAARLIGRETELAELTTALDTVIASVQPDTPFVGAAYLVGGESGVGKSRLLEELRTHALVSGALVLRGQGVSGSSLPFNIWRDVVRRLLIEIDVSDLEASILRELVPDIAALLEREIPPTPYVAKSAAQTRLMDNLLTVLQRLSQPTLLILEDLHWAVESLIPLKHLLRVMPHIPLLIVASYSPEDAPKLPGQVEGMHVITLERMTLEGIADLSAAMLGGAGRDEHLVDALYQYSRGNALLAVEMMRALADNAGDWQAIGEKGLPSHIFVDGVQALVQRRLQRLLDGAATTLQIAAVAGRKIDTALLRALSGAEVDAWLQAGLDAALLEIADDQWKFSHDQVRDAVLATIPETMLTQYHQRIAEGLEATHADSAAIANILYSHWRAAHVPEKEAYYATLVIEQRVLLSMLPNALDLVRQTLALNPEDDTVRLKLNLLGGEIQHDNGMPELAHDYYTQALTLARQINDLHAVGTALEGLATSAYALSDFPNAKRFYEESLAVRREIGDLSGIASTLNNMSTLQRFLGDYAGSYASVQEGMAIRRRIKDIHGLAYSLYQMAVHARMRGDYDEGVVYLLEGQELLRMMGDGRGLVENMNNLGLCYMLLGQLEDAYDIFIQSISLRHLMENTQDIVSMAIAPSNVQFQRQLARGYAMGMGSTLNSLADVQLLRGELASSLRYAGEALRIWLFYQYQWNIANSYASMAIIQLWLSERYSARFHLLEAMRLAQDLKAPLILLKALIGWARLCVLDQQPQQAAMLLGLVDHHSALTAQLKLTHFNALAASLPLDQYPDEYALGRTHDLYQVVQQIVADANKEDGL